MTRVAVLGATGRTGREILRQALDKGLEVNALAREPSKLGELGERVSVVKGDATDPVAVGRLVAGSGAVLSALGLVKGSPPDLMASSCSNIAAAMKKEGVKRLVILTNTGVKDPADRPPVTQRLLRMGLRVLNDRLLSDTIKAAEVIEESGLDWTLVRAPILTDGPKTGHYRVGALASGMPLRVSRADVADFMLSCALDAMFVREKPVIAG
ncbi:MAG TPA: NAD(P)H-binding protein [Nitrososphaerales archaeon]|nr:NAD(P)H-binding protein [Nitrososphaerales archaeon]